MGVVITVLIASLFTSTGTQAISEISEWIQERLPEPKDGKR